MRVPIGVVKEGERNPEHWISISGALSFLPFIRQGPAIDSLNNIYNSGGSASSLGVLTKYNKLGEIQFFSQTKLPDSAFESGTNIEIDPSGFLYRGSDGSTGFVARKYVTKYNSSFQAQWQRSFSISSLSGIHADSEGNVFVFGQEMPDTNRPWYNRAYLAKLNSSGTLLWQRVFGDNPPISSLGYEEFYGFASVATASDGSVYGSGFANYSNATGEQTVFVVKYNSSGVFQWKKRIDAPILSDYFSFGSIKVDSEDNVYVSGSIVSSSGPVGILIKIDPSGNILWQRAIAGALFAGLSNFTISGSTVYVPQILEDGGLLISSVSSSGVAITQRKIVLVGENISTAGVSIASNGTMYVHSLRLGTTYSNQSSFQISLPSDGSIYGSYKIGDISVRIEKIETTPAPSSAIEAAIQSTSGTATNSVTTPASQTITSVATTNYKVVV